MKKIMYKKKIRIYKNNINIINKLIMIKIFTIIKKKQINLINLNNY